MRIVHLKRIAAVVAAAGLLLTVAATPARAIALVGEYTLIDVTAVQALSSVGVTFTALGGAEIFDSVALGVKILLLPVTGGNVDLPTSFLGTIEHNGSGLRLSRLGVDLDLTNFLMTILTDPPITGTMSADVSVGGAPAGVVNIFNVLPCNFGPPGTCLTIPGAASIASPLGLRLTAEGAGVFEFALGIPGLTDVPFGVANTALTAVPEPGTAFLVGSALVGLAALRRDRRA